MKCILDALQDGRLIELIDDKKPDALQYLSSLIEAIPGIGHVEDLAERVLERELAHNTGIGHGWGCPHVRIKHDGELVCALGWSPGGIDYGSPDGQRVHLIVLYYVPETRKNAYLKEISLLAKAILKQDSLRDLTSLENLADARTRLLDAVTFALESTEPDARARMIKLDARPEPAPPAALSLDGHVILSFSLILTGNGGHPLALSQDAELTRLLETTPQIGEQLLSQKSAVLPGYRLLLRSESVYVSDRRLIDGLALRAG